LHWLETRFHIVKYDKRTSNCNVTLVFMGHLTYVLYDVLSLVVFEVCISLPFSHWNGSGSHC